MEVLGMLWTAPSLTFSAWPATWFGCISGDFSELGQRGKGLPPSRAAFSCGRQSAWVWGERARPPIQSLGGDLRANPSLWHVWGYSYFHTLKLWSKGTPLEME